VNTVPDTILRKDGETEKFVLRPHAEPMPVAAVTGTVFKDEDGDGRYSALSDTPIPGAMVSAIINDRVVATAYTDELGKYTLLVPTGMRCTLKAHLYSEAWYDPELKAWGKWSTVEGQKEIQCPSEAQDISISYRLLNYGPRDFSWELWHKGPIFKRKNVILVHGFRFPGASRRGRCDHQFGRLDDLLQTKQAGFNVWQFEYADRSLGTLGTVATYASRFAAAIERIAELTGADSFSVVGYSMGGIIARQYIATAAKSRIDKLLTLATPHMGTIRFEPFNLKWPDRLIPKAGAELRPDSRFLWDLNTNIESSSIPEMAAMGGYAWGHNDGFIEMSSTSPVKFNPDGTVAESFYFVAVNRSHTNINHITNEQDEVFQLIHSFLRDGVQGIRSMRPPERPGDYHVPYFLIFTLKRMPKWRMIYPFVVIPGKKRRYWGFRVFSQGAKTEDDSYIFTVQLRPDDEGEARVYYARDRYATVMLQKGQSTIVRRPLDSGFAVPEKSAIKTKWAKATG
jgi:pimeloyl-ACP methyl ester carboxylesterase